MANIVPGQPAIINVQPPERFIRRVGNRFGMMDPAVQEQPAFLNNFAPPNNFPNANLPAVINWNPPVPQAIPPMNMPLPNAQNNFDPEAIGTLEEMFPRIDIRKVLQIYHGQFNLERVAEFIINNEQTMPKKTESLKRKADTTLEATMNSISEDDPEEGTKVLDIVLKKLAAHFDSSSHQSPMLFRSVRTFLSSVFYKLRLTTVDYLAKCPNLKSMLIFGFFIQNGLLKEFKKYVNSMSHIPIWKKENDSLFLKNFRRRSDVYQITCPNHKTEFNEFLSILKGLQKEYPHILDGIELTSNAHTYLYDAAQESEEFECGVCFDFYSVSKRVMCGKANGGKRHQFCIECVRQQANVATGEMPLAEGAVGLKCMDGDCNNPIYYALIRNILPSAIRKRMDDRIQEENLAVAGLNLERCKNCNFAAEMNVDKNVNKVFDCLSCGKQWCRSCEKEWNDEHFGLSCEEYAKKSGDQARRDLEAKLSEAVVRKCHRCNFQFMKNDGCNKITCRCGAKQCYICREKDIDYNHFCQHARDPSSKSCNQCNKCGLWHDPNVVDKATTEKIQQEAGIQIQVPNFAPPAGAPLRPPARMRPNLAYIGNPFLNYHHNMIRPGHLPMPHPPNHL